MKRGLKAVAGILLGFLAVFVIATLKPRVGATEQIRESLRNTDELFVFEGLPHPIWEPALLDAEAKREDTLDIGGFPFYKPKVSVPDETAKILKRFAARSESYAVLTSGKLCGGFHPDYALSWSDSGKDYSILFCFGCFEAQFVEGKKTYRYDFHNIIEVREILAPFQSKRPIDQQG